MAHFGAPQQDSPVVGVADRNDRSEASRSSRYVPALVITISLFFLWGMANNLNDILIAQFKKAFALSDFGTSFVQQVFYLGYFLFALPASLVLSRYGYKAGIILGLLLYGLGALLFYPAALAGAYQLFLCALFIIAAGLAFLETSANPLMTELGDPATAARRLNWAQVANPFGAITGIFIGRNFILSGIEHDERALAAMGAVQRVEYYRTEVQAVATPYLAIACLVLLFALAAMLTRFPQARSVSSGAASSASPARLRDVIRDPQLRGAVFAQFCYVGAQVGLWSYTIRYANGALGLSERLGADMLFLSLLLFAVGRFVGTTLMGWLAPARVLMAFAAIAAMLATVAALAGGTLGLYALVATSFFMSIQFPTIFALGVAQLGAARRLGSSLLIMAIIGGAVFTGLIGWASDQVGIAAAMLIPAGCFLVVLAFAWRSHGAESNGSRH